MDIVPKPESLWGTCTYKAEGGVTLKAESRGKSWEMPFVEEFAPLEEVPMSKEWEGHSGDREDA